MPRKKRLRAELLNNGTLTGSNGIELGRIDLVEGVYIINEPAMYKWLMSTNYAQGITPTTKINMVFSPSGGYTADPAVTAVLLSMAQKQLITINRDEVTGSILTVTPIATVAAALKKLEPYTTRAEQLAGLEPLKED